VISKCFIVIFSFIILLLLFSLHNRSPPTHHAPRQTHNPQQPPTTHVKPSKAHQITPNPPDPIGEIASPTRPPQSPPRVADHREPDPIGEIVSPTRPPQSPPRVADHRESDPISEIATQHDPAKLIAKPRHHCEAAPPRSLL
jgi:hypothetical protein